MKSTVDLTAGQARATALFEEFKGKTASLNEADTRFRLINTFIQECLGWPTIEIRNETYTDGDYIDYLLGEPRSLVIEAKKAGIYFDFPADANLGRTARLRDIFAVSSSAEAAIRQAQSYCNDTGVEVAVVTNGVQIMAFIAIRIGSAWVDGKALIFRDHFEIIAQFPTIWQYLSPDGMAQRRIFEELTGGRTVSIPAKLSTSLLRYPSFRYKNDLQTNLRTMSELLLEDVIRTPEMKKQFYRDCYCETGALSRDAILSQNILAARYASLFPTSEAMPALEAVTGGTDAPAIRKQVLTEATARRPIVLLGDVGVGKTSFLEDLMYVRAEKEFNKAINIYIDFGSQAALEDDIKLFFIRETERQLYEKYGIDVMENNFIRGVYDLDVKRFRNSFRAARLKDGDEKLDLMVDGHIADLCADDSTRLKRSIEHISKARRNQIVFMLDNADQRSHDIQQEAFIIAQELSQNWEALVFIAVRPDTFYRSKQSGALSAYPHKVFTIMPPRPETVIEKRLMFALKTAEGRHSPEWLSGVRLHIDSLANFIRALLYSMKHNRQLTEVLANITGGNIRAVVEFVTEFIGSPNVEAEKIVRLQRQSGKYMIPIHEFTKAAILGDHSHYNPVSSLALNMFDVSLADVKDHFSRSLVVAYLLSDQTTKDRDGFVTRKSVVDELQRLGFLPTQTLSAISRLADKRLIEGTERGLLEAGVYNPEGEIPGGLRVTSIGAYHLRRWLGEFSYLDAMSFDTPIMTKQYRDGMLAKVEGFEIRDRYDRTTCFRNYLTHAWESLRVAPYYFNWIEIVSAGDESFRRVATHLDRARS